MMQLIPMANQMLGDIMSKYGFNEENGGVMGFLNVLQGSDDDEAGSVAHFRSFATVVFAA